jgi:hypothetical protein
MAIARTKQPNKFIVQPLSRSAGEKLAAFECNGFNRFFGYRTFAFFKTMVSDPDVREIRKTRFFQYFFSAIHGATVDDQQPGRGSGRFDKIAEPCSDAREAVHFSRTPGGQRTPRAVRDSANISGSGTGKHQFCGCVARTGLFQNDSFLKRW